MRAIAGVVVMVMAGAARAEPRVIDVPVTSAQTDASEVVMPVELADGARVIAMSVVSGGARMEAVAMRADRAFAQYRNEVDRERDPALLEQTPDGRVTLHVYPVSRDRPAVVELTVEDRSWPLVPAALYAALPPPAGRGHRAIVISDPGIAEVRDTSLTASEIRDVVRLHEPAVRHCYLLAAQRDPSLAGDLELHFLIGADGAIASASVDGALPSDEVRACVAREVVGWTFRAGGRPVAVNYPLTLRAR